MITLLRPRKRPLTPPGGEGGSPQVPIALRRSWSRTRQSGRGAVGRGGKGGTTRADCEFSPRATCSGKGIVKPSSGMLRPLRWRGRAGPTPPADSRRGGRCKEPGGGRDEAASGGWEGGGDRVRRRGPRRSVAAGGGRERPRRLD